MKIGMIGLGAMGGGIAANLAKYVSPLFVFDPHAPAISRLEAAGSTACSSPAELAAKCDLVFLCVPFEPEVRAALFGKDGISHGAKSGLTVVDLTTLYRDDALEIAAQAKETGIAYWDCPVSGTPARADDATLTVMFGGTDEAFATAKPYLEHFGEFIVHCGPLGAGQAMKAINNIIYNVNIAALCEVLPLATASGLDPEKVASVVTSGSARSFASERFVARMLDGSFEGDYPMAGAYKDIVNVRQLASEKDAKLPVVDAMVAAYDAAIEAGFGHEPKSAMLKVYEKALGVQFRKAGHEAD